MIHSGMLWASAKVLGNPLPVNMTTICTGKTPSMATPVFVDTGAHYALTDVHDPDHAEAVRLLQQIAHHRQAMVTSNFVISESYTLIIKRVGWEIAIRYVESLKAGSTRIIRVSSEDDIRAWEILRRYRDQDFSYVDATSFAVMERLGFQVFFAFDGHFNTFRTRQGQAFTNVNFIG
jgi:predicted nucleic acid-binding protein